MKPRIKSLLYLACFSLSALLYYQIEENDKEVKSLNNPNYASAEIEEIESPEINTGNEQTVVAEEIK
jgi:hypothetical protein